MQHDREYLLDMLEAAKIINDYIGVKEKDEFLQDNFCQDAVIRRLAIIGEAANRISEQTRTRVSEIPWVEIIGMRNRLIHQYDDLDINIVWETINKDIPILITELEKIVPLAG